MVEKRRTGQIDYKIERKSNKQNGEKSKKRRITFDSEKEGSNGGQTIRAYVYTTISTVAIIYNIVINKFSAHLTTPTVGRDKSYLVRFPTFAVLCFSPFSIVIRINLYSDLTTIIVHYTFVYSCSSRKSSPTGRFLERLRCA